MIKNKALWLIGKNEDGIINNKQEGGKISTEGQFIKTFDCIDFSMCKQMLVCDSFGVLAGWGRVYCDKD